MTAGYGWRQILAPLQLTMKPVLQLGKLRPREKAFIFLQCNIVSLNKVLFSVH